MTLRQVIEALLFASPKPLTIPEMVSALQSAGEKAEEDGPAREFATATPEHVEEALRALGEDYTATGRGFTLVEQINGWVLLTNPETAAWVRRLYPEAKPTRLSGPALETLAIIAYRQPVTRADMEAVRGVAVDGVMQVLLDRQLVKIAGRAEVPGRPLLYATTEYFLQHFGMKSLTELPNSAELKRIPLPKAPVPEEPKPATTDTPAAEAAPAVVETPTTPPDPVPATPEETLPAEPASAEPETHA